MAGTLIGLSVDPNCDKDKARPPAQYVSARALSAASEQVTVPTGAVYCLVEVTADTYLAFGANPTAAVPVDTDDGTSYERVGNSEGKWFLVAGIAKIAAYSASGIATFSFYKS